MANIIAARIALAVGRAKVSVGIHADSGLGSWNAVWMSVAISWPIAVNVRAWKICPKAFGFLYAVME